MIVDNCSWIVNCSM